MKKRIKIFFAIGIFILVACVVVFIFAAIFQRNAIADAHGYANLLAGALNNHNFYLRQNLFTTADDIYDYERFDGGQITLAAGRSRIGVPDDLLIDFETEERTREIIGYLVYEDFVWRVNEDAIRAAYPLFGGRR
jgi:hypothetical protein